MSGTFYLKCLGAPELRTPSGRAVRMRGHKPLALLIYLAVERRAQYRRDELAVLLWPDAAIREARHSLATAVSAIRRVIGPGSVTGDRELLHLDHQLITLDVDRLESGELFATPHLPAVEVDGFLDAFELRDAPAFTDWRDRQHARWLPAIHAALLRLIDHARRTGASRTAGLLAGKLLAIDELSEDGVRAKMEALAFAGDRLAALRVYEEWRVRLGKELDAVPSKLVEEMARRLRRRGLDRPVADPAPSVQIDPWRDRPFVGRAEEHRLLYEAWESTLQTIPRHVLVEGESGVGKSTLVERLAMAAALQGAIVSRGQCYELERAIPFAAIAALVIGLLDKPGVSSTDPAALAEVARVVPKVRERFPGLPAPLESQGETARLHFAEGVLAMLEAAMEEHPVILVVDDFHLADEASLTVLHLLLRRLDQVRLMVLLTMRTSELAQTSGAARVYGGGEYLRMSRIHLPPLSEAESGELLTRLLPGDRPPPTPPVRHTLLQASRGIPMVMQLLVQDWHRHGNESLALSLRAMTTQLGTEGAGDTDGTYRRIVERILGDLDPMTSLVLQAASVLASRVSDLALYSITDLASSQMMMGLNELTKRHILRDSPTGLDFVNELVRGYAYSAMPAALRQGFHAAIADHLLARLAAGKEPVRGLEIAWHLVRGGRPADAVEHLLRGAREAIREGAPHEAELALRTALAEDQLLVSHSRSEALLLHAEVLQELALWQASLHPLHDLPAEISTSHAERAELLRLVATHHLEPPGSPTSSGLIDRLTSMAASCSDLLVRARSAATAAYLLEQQQTVTQPPELWHAIAVIESLCTDPETRAHALQARATLYYHRRDLVQSSNDTSAAIGLLETHQIANSAYAGLLIGHSALHCALGEYEAAMTPACKAYQLARRLDNDHLARRAANNIALAYGRMGNYDAQFEWSSKALNHLHPTQQGYALVITALSVGYSKAMRYDTDTIETYKRIVSRVNISDHQWVVQACLLIEADLYQLLGKQRQALSAAQKATTGDYSRLLAIGWAGRFVRWYVLTRKDADNLAEARELLAPFITDLDRFDAIDRIEIGASYLLVAEANAPNRDLVRAKAISLLSRMPSAVTEQLDRLGMISPLRGASKI